MNLALTEKYLEAHIRGPLDATPTPGVFDPDALQGSDGCTPQRVVFYSLGSADMTYADDTELEAIYNVLCIAPTRPEARDLLQALARSLGSAGWNVAANGEGAVGESGWWSFQGEVSADSASGPPE